MLSIKGFAARAAILASVQILSIGLVTIGAINIAGYALDVNTLYAWARGVGMALATAICFVGIGISLLLLAAVIAWEDSATK